MSAPAYLAANRRILQQFPQMGSNPHRVCPDGFLPVTARTWTASGGGESLFYVEATHAQDAFAAVREWFKSPAWKGYEIVSLSR